MKSEVEELRGLVESFMKEKQVKDEQPKEDEQQKKQEEIVSMVPPPSAPVSCLKNPVL